MDLKTYLRASKQTQTCFARRLGVSQGLVSRMAAGRNITAERAVQIERVSRKKILRHELRPDLFIPGGNK